MVFASFELEKSLWNKGYKYVCGVDEVGRGCFAGPVVAGAVVFPVSCALDGVADSKLLSASQRERIDAKIKCLALCWAVSEVNASVIDDMGIGEATQIAYLQALQSLNTPSDFVLVDAFCIKRLDKQVQMAVKGGDTICSSIAAASVVAKVYRDKLMSNLHQKYPQYGFAKHKGYGTAEHRAAIQKYGLCKLHRKSFNIKW